MIDTPPPPERNYDPPEVQRAVELISAAREARQRRRGEVDADVIQRIREAKQTAQEHINTITDHGMRRRLTQMVRNVRESPLWDELASSPAEEDNEDEEDIEEGEDEEGLDEKSIEELRAMKEEVERDIAQKKQELEWEEVSREHERTLAEQQDLESERAREAPIDRLERESAEVLEEERRRSGDQNGLAPKTRSAAAFDNLVAGWIEKLTPRRAPAQAPVAPQAPAASQGPRTLQEWLDTDLKEFPNKSEKANAAWLVMETRGYTGSKNWPEGKEVEYAEARARIADKWRKWPRAISLATSVVLVGGSIAAKTAKTGALVYFAGTLGIVAPVAVGAITALYVYNRNKSAAPRAIVQGILVGLASYVGTEVASSVVPWAMDQLGYGTPDTTPSKPRPEMPAGRTTIDMPSTAEVPQPAPTQPTPQAPAESPPVETSPTPPPAAQPPVVEQPVSPEPPPAQPTPTQESPAPAPEPVQPAPQAPTPEAPAVQPVWKAPLTLSVEGAIASSGIDGLVNSKFLGADGFLQKMGYQLSPVSGEQIIDALRRTLTDPVLASEIGARVVPGTDGLDLGFRTGATIHLSALGGEQALGELAHNIQLHEKVLFNELGGKAGLETFMSKWSSAFGR